MLGKKSFSGRNRPPTKLDGKPAAAVFSYHAKRSFSAQSTGRRESPQVSAAWLQKRDKLHGWLAKSAIAIGLVLVLAVVAINLPLMNPIGVRVVGGTTAGQVFLRSGAIYASAAESILAASPARNSNKLTLDRTGLALELKQRFPELAAIRVLTPLFGQHLVIELQPVMPALLLTTTRGEVFLLDTAGRALVSATQAKSLDRLKLSVVNDLSGLEVKPGRTVLPNHNVAFIKEVVGQLKAKHLEIISLFLPTKTHQLEVRVKGAPYTIRFNLEGDVRAETGTYLAVKAYVERLHIVPGTYIDVRVDGRAYYK